MRHVCRKTSTCCTCGDELRLVPGDASLLDNVWSGRTGQRRMACIRWSDCTRPCYKWQGEAQFFSSRQHVSFETILFACKKVLYWWRFLCVLVQTCFRSVTWDSNLRQEVLTWPNFNVTPIAKSEHPQVGLVGTFARACESCQTSTRLAEQHLRLFKLTLCARHLQSRRGALFVSYPLRHSFAHARSFLHSSTRTRHYGFVFRKGSIR